MEILIPVIVGLIAAGGAFFLGQKLKTTELKKTAENAEKVISDAEIQKKEILLGARDEANKIKQEGEEELKQRREELKKVEKRLESKEENIDRRQETLDKKIEEIETRSEKIKSQEKDILESHQKALDHLQRISGLTKEEAKKLLLEEIEKDVKQEAVRLIREVEEATKEEADKKAREILVVSMQRIASEVTSETTVFAIPLPSDDLKGRIIGREGRNIRTLEQLTGVTFTIDDTPETIVVSCFDPIRREVARMSLEMLVKDGRIHPARIEEVVEKCKKEVSKEIKEAGEKALYETGIAGIPAEITKLLGRLKFRTSYGQNVLKHSIEVCHIAGLLAAELKENVALAKKAGLLHDIGKAVDHEVEGSHATIGKDILDRFDFQPEITWAVGAHHEDIELRSPLDYIVQIADAISASRPGARFDNKEQFINRVNEIETIANSFGGVKQSYALQAGREVRVFVNPADVDDLSNIRLARDIAKKIEETLKYPGQIKVVTIRETRATELAK